MTDSIDHEQIRQRVEKQMRARAELSIHLSVFAISNGIAWLLWWATQDFIGFMWPLLLTLAWGAGLAGHAMDVYRHSARSAERIKRAVAAQMRHLYGDDWRETASEVDYETIRKYTEKYDNKRGEFLVHLPVFVLINMMFLFLWLEIRSTNGFPWPLIPMGGWTVGLLGHLIDVANHSPRRIISRERACSGRNRPRRTIVCT